MEGETVTELVEYWGTRDDSHIPAFISFDETGCKRELSRRQVLHYSKRFAFRLKNLGVCKGDIVVNALPNCVERIVCDFGILFCGAASLNGQIFRSDGEDFLHALELSKCQIVVVDPDIRHGARDILFKEVPHGTEKCVNSKRLPCLQYLVLCQRDDDHPQKDFLSSLSDPNLPEVSVKVSGSDLATVMTTSGSTGYSKLVKLSHANICHFGLQVKAIESLKPGEHFINCAPLGWAGGYPQWYLACGITRYFYDMHNGPPKDLPLAIWKTIVEEQIVYGFLSPMYVNAILDQPALWKDVSWKPRALCLAGQPVKKDLLRIIGRLCKAVDINYGITECNLVTTHRLTDAASYVDGCAGYPGYGVQMKIVNRDGKEVAPGTTGEVIIWSPSLCQGYLNGTSPFTADGWFYTDDAGYIGEDGKLYVEGRQSDSILHGAYILYPGWMENKLRAVAGVQDVVIVGVSDPVLHSEICAFVLTGTVTGTVVGRLQDDERIQLDQLDGQSWLSNKQGSSSSTYTLPKTLDQIRSEGLRKPLSVEYNETKAVVTQSNGVEQSTSQLEKNLRQCADDMQVLSKKDAMRMVPKYYIFTDKLPLTNTGKISRKEIRRISTSLLGLETK